jgi:hypothetical protein
VAHDAVGVGEAGNCSQNPAAVGVGGFDQNSRVQVKSDYLHGHVHILGEAGSVAFAVVGETEESDGSSQMLGGFAMARGEEAPESHDRLESRIGSSSAVVVPGSDASYLALAIDGLAELERLVTHH